MPIRLASARHPTARAPDRPSVDPHNAPRFYRTSPARDLPLTSRSRHAAGFPAPDLGPCCTRRHAGRTTDPPLLGRPPLAHRPRLEPTAGPRRRPGSTPRDPTATCPPTWLRTWLPTGSRPVRSARSPPDLGPSPPHVRRPLGARRLPLDPRTDWLTGARRTSRGSSFRPPRTLAGPAIGARRPIGRRAFDPRLRPRRHPRRLLVGMLPDYPPSRGPTVPPPSTGRRPTVARRSPDLRATRVGPSPTSPLPRSRPAAELLPEHRGTAAVDTPTHRVLPAVDPPPAARRAPDSATTPHARDLADPDHRLVVRPRKCRPPPSADDAECPDHPRADSARRPDHLPPLDRPQTPPPPSVCDRRSPTASRSVGSRSGSRPPPTTPGAPSNPLSAERRSRRLVSAASPSHPWPTVPISTRPPPTVSPRDRPMPADLPSRPTAERPASRLQPPLPSPLSAAANPGVVDPTRY